VPVAVAALALGVVYGASRLEWSDLPAIPEIGPLEGTATTASPADPAPEFVGRELGGLSEPAPEAEPPPTEPAADEAPKTNLDAASGALRAVPVAAPAVQTERPPAPGRENAATGTAEPSVVSFARVSTTVRESASMASIELVRTGPLERPVAIVWWTSAASARAGDDYAAFNRRVETIPAGARTHMLHVPLVSDGLPEADEYFEVHIADPEPRYVRLGTTHTTVKLVDDDL
jgi:hypothetical protein